MSDMETTNRANLGSYGQPGFEQEREVMEATKEQAASDQPTRDYWGDLGPGKPAEQPAQVINLDSCDTSRDVRNGFICAAWTVFEEGPILDLATRRRRRVVFRCDRPHGHEGQHVDHVLATNWQGPLEPEDASTSGVDAAKLKEELKHQRQETEAAVQRVATLALEIAENKLWRNLVTARLNFQPSSTWQQAFDAITEAELAADQLRERVVALALENDKLYDALEYFTGPAIDAVTDAMQDAAPGEG